MRADHGAAHFARLTDRKEGLTANILSINARAGQGIPVDFTSENLEGHQAAFVAQDETTGVYGLAAPTDDIGIGIFLTGAAIPHAAKGKACVQTDDVGAEILGNPVDIDLAIQRDWRTIRQAGWRVCRSQRQPRRAGDALRGTYCGGACSKNAHLKRKWFLTRFLLYCRLGLFARAFSHPAFHRDRADAPLLEAVAMGCKAGDQQIGPKVVAGP